MRAFECEGNWSTMPPAMLQRSNSALNLPIERFGPGHNSSFYPPTYGAGLLAHSLSSSSSDEHLGRFHQCAQREVSPTILHKGPWHGSAGPRPTSLLRDDLLNVPYATYANSFGFTLRGSTRVIGAHAFDAWTTKPRPFCENEESQAARRMHAVRRFCSNMTTGIDRKSGAAVLTGDHLKGWPVHVALSRTLANSDANCRIRTQQAMLRQQKLFLTKLRASGLLDHCPHALYAGAISQVAAIYNLSDVTGIFVLDWVPSHLPLAALAFNLLPPWSDSRRRGAPLRLVRFSLTHSRVHYKGKSQTQERDSVTCSCHELPSASAASMAKAAVSWPSATNTTARAKSAMSAGAFLSILATSPGTWLASIFSNARAFLSRRWNLPTAAPAVGAPHPPAGACAYWCESHADPWEGKTGKCSFAKCASCVPCQSLPPVHVRVLPPRKGDHKRRRPSAAKGGLQTRKGKAPSTSGAALAHRETPQDPRG